MSVEERHLLNKIRFFEDMLLRSKDYRQQENIGKELTVMRIRLQKLRFTLKVLHKQWQSRECKQRQFWLLSVEWLLGLLQRRPLQELDKIIVIRLLNLESKSRISEQTG